MGLAKRQMMEDDGFTAFLQEVVDGGGLDGAPLGIAELVIEKGREELSAKQEAVFQSSVLDEYVTDECGRCSNGVPWSEMMLAYENGGFCGYCDHMMNKDD